VELSSSKVVATAMGLLPEGIPAPQTGRCAFCGIDIHQGDLYTKFSVGPGFMDTVSLAAKGSGMTCGHCTPLMGASALISTARGVYSPAGVVPFAKWADIGTALREPPEPPFVMLYATANSQHMAWRAKVNLSRELFYVRVGLRDLKIRRETLLSAVPACERIGTYMGIEATAKSIAHPFASLSSDLKEVSHSLLRAKGKSHAIEEAYDELPEDFALLHSLTLGETWGLRFLLSPNAGTTTH
jgi:CRISPR type IV-associated protein Csf1